MASLLRLNRAVAVSSSILRYLSSSSITSHSSQFPLLIPRRPVSHHQANPSKPFPFQIQSSSFHSSIPLAIKRFDLDHDGKIPEDEILFEGCDYNHWLITMDFPKDPKPSPEEMVETYVQTLAKVVGSEEEAKKRMYACSTTTYNGFQAVMTEEVSEKFRGLPGVVFILPDSYIDPVNKEYGGDKYDNGVITPRPPPVQYGRQGRYGDRNRRFDQPRYDRPRSPPMQGRDPQQNYGPPGGQQGPGQGYERGYNPQQNYGPPGDSQQGGYAPPQQGYNGRNFGPPPTDGRGYGPPGPTEGRGYGQPGPTEGRGYNPPGPTDGRGYNPPLPTEGRGYNPPGPTEGRGYNPPGPTDGRGYNPPIPTEGRGYNPNGPTDGSRYNPPSPTDRRGYSPSGDTRQGYMPNQRDNPPWQQGQLQSQSGNPPYSRNFGEEQRGYPSTQQGSSPWQQGGNPQMQSGNPPFSRNIGDEQRGYSPPTPQGGSPQMQQQGGPQTYSGNSPHGNEGRD